MNDVWSAIAELCLELHPDRVAAIASGISEVAGVDELGRMRDRFGPNAGKELFRKLREAWDQADGISPAEIAAGLKSASATAAMRGAKGSVELVWSGPETQEVPVRQTEEVICQVIESSQTKLLIISFAVYRIDRILKCLEAARARGVVLDVLMEASEAQGGNVGNGPHLGIIPINPYKSSINFSTSSLGNSTTDNLYTISFNLSGVCIRVNRRMIVRKTQREISSQLSRGAIANPQKTKKEYPKKVNFFLRVYRPV